MSQPPDFNEPEWTLLKRAPLLVFYYVANSDDNVESHEVEKLIRQFDEPERYNSSFFSTLVQDLMSNPDELAALGSEVISTTKEKVHLQFAGIQELVDSKLDPAESKSFKEALLMLGTDIASASGDAELPVSKEEWAEVSTFRKLLKL